MGRAARDELTDTAADAAIEQACRILRLPTIRERHGRHCCVVPSLCASGHDHSNVRTGQMVIARSSKAMRSRWRPGTSVAIS